jgi:hypothetical protein
MLSLKKYPLFIKTRLMFLLFYLLVCILVGAFGAKRPIGFVLTTILAMFITPPIMALILLLTAPKSAKTAKA